MDSDHSLLISVSCHESIEESRNGQNFRRTFEVPVIVGGFSIDTKIVEIIFFRYF